MDPLEQAMLSLGVEAPPPVTNADFSPEKTFMQKLAELFGPSANVPRRGMGEEAYKGALERFNAPAIKRGSVGLPAQSVAAARGALPNVSGFDHSRMGPPDPFLQQVALAQMPQSRRPVSQRPVSRSRGALPPTLQAEPITSVVPDDYNELRPPMEVAPDATAATAAPEARKNLADRFRERMGSVKEGDTALTEKQKKDRLLEVGLAMMAAASKPGASLFSSFGEGGLRGTAVGREMERQNVEQGNKRRSESRDDAKTEIAFEDKDQDNKRLEAQQKALEAFHKTQNSIAERALNQKITQQQAQLELSQAQLDLKRQLGEAANAVQVARLDAATARSQAASDKTPAEVRLMQWLAGDPKRMEQWTEMQGVKRTKENDPAKLMIDYMAKNPLATPQDARAAVDAALSTRTGEPAPTTKPDPAQFKGKVIVGPDGKFKSDGKNWVKQ